MRYSRYRCGDEKAGGYNREKLHKAVAISHHYNITKALCEILDITPSTARRSYEEGSFTRGEISILAQDLKLTPEEVAEIFFDRCVDKVTLTGEEYRAMVEKINTQENELRILTERYNALKKGV